MTRTAQPHVYQPLTASSHDGYWPPQPVLEGDSDNHQWQMLAPKMSASCAIFPDGSATDMTHPEKQLVLQAMKNMPSALRQDVLDDAARRVARGGVQNPLAYLLATLRKAQDGEFNQYRRDKSAVSEFVPPAVPEPEEPAKPRKKRDISKLVAEIRAQCLGSG